MSREEVEELDDEGKNVLEKASFGVELRPEESAFLVYREGEPAAPKVKEMGSKKRKLSSSTILVSGKKRKTARRSVGGEEDRVRRPEVETVVVDVDEENATAVSREL